MSILVDTDVLIWHLRGYPQSTRRLDQLPSLILSESLVLSHGLGMGDALIAATALEHGHAVLTANVKHFSAVEHLQLDEFVI